MEKLKLLVTQSAIGIALLIFSQVQATPTEEIMAREDLTGWNALASSLATNRDGSSFDVSWFAVSGGGPTSVGGGFELTATIGQVDAGIGKGGDFSITGGFGAGFQDLPIFGDGFESGDLSAWSIHSLIN